MNYIHTVMTTLNRFEIVFSQKKSHEILQTEKLSVIFGKLEETTEHGEGF